MANFYCGHCMSENVEETEYFQGDKVKPEDCISWEDKHSGIVVRCKDCDDVTGFLIIITGVIDDKELSE